MIVAILVLGLVAFARGRDHHRGPQQVGAMADASHVSTIAPV